VAVPQSDVKQLQRMFNEVRPVRGFEDITLQIQQAILDGHLKAGDRLPNERELGSVFGVSRPTLREAIRSLEAAGIVEVRRGMNGGTFITEPKADQVGQALATLIRFRGATADELAEFRVSFESETALWAAKRATQGHAERLQKIAEDMKQAVYDPATTWSSIVDLDLDFHVEVAHASQNQIRVAIMLAIHDVIRRAALTIGDVEDMSWRQQQASDLNKIAAAIGQHDVDAAKQLMEDHVSRNVQAVVRDNERNLLEPDNEEDVPELEE
jgi:GntR family transcriptional repressor for pyruvate dehydrogenase complex